MSFDTTVERIEQLHEGSGSFLCRIHTKRFGIISDCSVARQLRPKERFIKDRWTDEIDTARGSISVAPSGEAIGALLLTPVLASALVLLTRRPRIF